MNTLLLILFVFVLCFFAALLDKDRKRRKEEKENSTSEEKREEKREETEIRQVMTIGNATVTVSSVSKELKDTPIQPRKYSKSNAEFGIYGDDYKGYVVGIKNENMKPKEIDFKVDSLETALALTEELHRYRAKLNDNSDYRDVFVGDLPRNPIKKFHLKGLEYRRPKATKIYNSLKEGEKVLLVKEPTNPYDENAVKVYATNGEHLGYVPREKAKEIGELFHHVGYAWVHHESGMYSCNFLVFLKYIEYDESSDNYPYEEPNEKFTKQ